MNIRIGSKIVSENIIRYIASIFLITLSFYFYIDREMVALSLLSLLQCLVLIYLFDGRRDLFSPKYFFSYLYIFGFCIRPLLLYYKNQGFYIELWSFSYEEFVEYSSLALIYSHVALFLFVVGYNSFAPKYQLKIGLVREAFVNSEFSSLKYAYSLLLLGIVTYLLYVNKFDMSFIQFLSSSVNIEKTGNYAYQLLSFFILFSTALLFINKERSFTRIFILFLFSIIVSLSFHERKWLILFFIMIIAMRHYYYEFVSIKKMSMYGILFLVILVFLIFIRNYFYIGGGELINSSFMGKFFDHVVLGGMFGYFDYFAYLLKAFEGKEHLIEHGLAYAPLQFVPTSLADLLGLTKLPSVSTYVASFMDNTARAPAVSAFGEVWVIGSGISYVFIFPLLGAYFKWNYMVLTRSKNGILYYSIFLFYFILFVRTGFLSSWVSYFATFVFVYIFTAFYQLMVNSYRRGG